MRKNMIHKSYLWFWLTMLAVFAPCGPDLVEAQDFDKTISKLKDARALSQQNQFALSLIHI